MTGMRFPGWAAIRRDLPRLVLGVERAGVAVELAGQAFTLAAGDPAYFSLGRELLLWNWRRRPLNVRAAAQLFALERIVPFPPGRMKNLLAALAALGPPAGTSGHPGAPAPEDGPGAALAFLEKAAGSPEAFLVRLPLVMETLEEAGAHFALWELCARVPWDGPFAPLGPRLAAESAFFTRPPSEALRALAKTDPEIFDGWTGLFRAALVENMGGREEAAGLFAALSARLPWHPGLRLLARAKRDPGPAPLARDPGAAVLVYAWNNAPCLEKTLAGLLASDLGGCPVICLDNGSTDDTAALLAAARDRYAGRIEVVTLPVNVGAPAARNWLLRLPQVRDRAFAAFVDDDAFLPPDWLAFLHGALSRHPGAGAAGCRVVDAARPWRMQSADMFVLPPQALAEDEPDQPRENAGFDIFDPSTRQPDPGLFAYSRPCLSVTGCCHLLRREALVAAGPFDLRFSPSQFDDFERDLRAFLAGFPCVYEGRLTASHAGGAAGTPTPGKLANAKGNRVKLEALYPPQVIEKASEEGLRLAWEDFLEPGERDGAP